LEIETFTTRTNPDFSHGGIYRVKAEFQENCQKFGFKESAGGSLLK